MAARGSRPHLRSPEPSPRGKQPGSTLSGISAEDPRSAAAAQLETDSANIRGVGEGGGRAVNPDAISPRSDEEDRPTTGRRSPETSLSTKVPQSVMQQLRRRYAESGVTIRNQILIALRKDGLEIDDDDIRDERKRPRRFGNPQIG